MRTPGLSLQARGGIKKVFLVGQQQTLNPPGRGGRDWAEGPPSIGVQLSRGPVHSGQLELPGSTFPSLGPKYLWQDGETICG